VSALSLRTCQRARERGLLIVEVVLQLLAIELDEHLTRLHAIAEVGQHTADRAVGL
jgi:hypothetical protein